MNRHLLKLRNAVAMVIIGASLFACTDKEDDVDPSSSTDELRAILKQFVEVTVLQTYKQLADESLVLRTKCEELRQNPTQQNVDAACAQWIEARKYWEHSEAFLFGPASDDFIDPHIDSWPLDKNQLDQMLANSYIMGQLSADYVGKLPHELLGFHALEYVIFRDGHPRNISQIPASELLYAACVAEDVARQCVKLEASWAGIDKVSADKAQLLTACNLLPAVNYGQLLMTAGSNDKFRTQKAGLAEIIMGCSDIADEVANTKITDPVAEQDVLAVESWYSWNSIADFADNIRGVGFAYYGQRAQSPHTHSVSAYLNKTNPSLDGKIRQAIANAIREIENIPYPFRNHLTEAETDAAKQACQRLQALLDEAYEEIQEN